jgi:hypothetical protein
MMRENVLVFGNGRCGAMYILIWFEFARVVCFWASRERYIFCGRAQCKQGV